MTRGAEWVLSFVLGREFDAEVREARELRKDFEVSPYDLVFLDFCESIVKLFSKT